MVTQIKTLTEDDYASYSDLNAEFQNIYNALNSGVAATIANGSITDIKLDDGASVQTYFGELFQDSVVLSGLTYISDTGLNVTIAAGTAYVLKTSTTPDKLVRIEVASSTYGVLDNTTNYLDLGSDGVIDVSQSATPATDHIRFLKVIASSAAIDSTEDVADRNFLTDTISASQPKQMEWTITSNTEVVIQSGARFRENTWSRTYEFEANITIDISGSTGVLGLDQGSEASGTWYAIVALGDLTGVLAPTAMLVSAANYPASIIIPTGYNHYRRIGWVRNNGSSNFLQGSYYDAEFWYEDETEILTAGSATSFATVSCVSVMPPTTRTAYLSQNSDTSSGNKEIRIRPTGSGASTGLLVDLEGATAITYSFFKARTNTTQQFDYKGAGGSLTVDIQFNGYIDTLEKDS